MSSQTSSSQPEEEEDKDKQTTTAVVNKEDDREYGKSAESFDSDLAEVIVGLENKTSLGKQEL